ncbi:unnamed protein product [Rotaria sp. Silwood1]|nr:unnamed protein product [Rotaria sp. Silwood1]
MSTPRDVDVVQINVQNDELLEIVKHTETVASGKCILPKWVSVLLVIILILTIIGTAVAMGYYTSSPRSKFIIEINNL